MPSFLVTGRVDQKDPIALEVKESSRAFASQAWIREMKSRYGKKHQFSIESVEPVSRFRETTSFTPNQ